MDDRTLIKIIIDIDAEDRQAIAAYYGQPTASSSGAATADQLAEFARAVVLARLDALRAGIEEDDMQPAPRTLETKPRLAPAPTVENPQPVITHLAIKNAKQHSLF